ncbi:MULTISPECIES: hypothetical protein [Streptomyces]|uniref:DUF2335 domain-containing protein n=1 Tax=Streptomyces olivaceoviridis TaxID=1921 RepID=A0ABW7VR32_STROI|nr:hypothetical protein [Streptomyces corchorusii]
MSLGEPLPARRDDDPFMNAAMGIAARWGEVLGPEKLEVALKALEPELKREHQFRLRRLEAKEAEAERQAAAAQAEAERAAREVIEKRHHMHRIATLVAGMVASLTMLGGGLYIAPHNAWLAAGLCGPSLLALVKIFVLQRSDDGDMRAAERTARDAANAASASSAGPPVV